MTRWLISLMAMLLAAALPVSAFAQQPPKSPEAVEQQARDVGRQLRCVVCQNQSIEESDAPLAADMRRLVRKELADGASEADVIALMRDRYGDYVLLMPPVQGNTLILWVGPAALLLLLLLWWIVLARRKPARTEAAALSGEELAQLDALRKTDT